MSLLIALLISPFLFGVINRVKAIFGGRRGQPLLQTYFDLFKLLRKGAVYSRTTTWVFRAGSVGVLAATILAAGLVPFGGMPSLLSFSGDIILLAYLLGLARFLTVAAALDTGSSFEAMGASREVQFSALSEPALLLGLLVAARATGGDSLAEMFTAASALGQKSWTAPLALACVALFVVLLAENSRIPVDDPNTHLELTMIHEVMVLDHGGLDLAFIVSAAGIKLWIMAALLVGILVPIHAATPLSALVASIAAMIVLAMGVGLVESCMARLRLTSVPVLLVGALALTSVALMLGSP